MSLLQQIHGMRRKYITAKQKTALIKAETDSLHQQYVQLFNKWDESNKNHNKACKEEDEIRGKLYKLTAEYAEATDDEDSLQLTIGEK